MDLKLAVEEVELGRLRDHPRQSEFFTSATHADIEELADDLIQRGQQEPIHICPDGTIIRGHRRVAAAKRLGWKSIKAVVRHDLPDPGSDATVAELIVDNVKRQQLDDLALARCYHELKKTSVRAANQNTSGDVRDRLAARLRSGKSGRSLDRLERLLKLPRDIQDMISADRLNKFQAEKILRLPTAKRDAVISDLRREERVLDVLRRYNVIKPVTSKSAVEMGEELLRYFHSHLKELSRNIKSLDRLQLRGGDVVKLLDESTKFMSAWANRKRVLKQQALESVMSDSVPRRPDKLSNEAR